MKYRSLFVAILMYASFSTTIAQTVKETVVSRVTDSLRMEGLSNYAKLYPLLRQGFFATDFMGNANVKSQLSGKDLYEGKMNITRIRSLFNVPISQWGKNTITGTVAYQQQHFETTDVKSYNPQFSDMDRTITKRTGSISATFSRSDSIFNQLVIYSAGITGITDELSSVKRVNYLGSVLLPLKKTQYSSLTIGVVVILDPSAILPVIPVVSYWHKFKGPDLDLFMDLPSRVILRKQLSKRSWTSVGSELQGSLLFFDVNQPGLPQNSISTNIEFRSGATFEYLVTKKLIIGVNGGLYSTTAWRMFDHNDKPDQYFYKSQASTVPYVSFSISFLPFLKHL